MKAIAQHQKTTTVTAPKLQAAMPVQTSEDDRPDIATQLAGAALFGHHLSAVNVQSRSPLLVQPKLTVGPTNDKYEQEADRVAQQVMATPAPVQRQDELDEDDEIQMKSLVQRQDELDDEDELQMKPQIQRRDELGEDDELQMKPLVQRFSAGGFETDGDFESRLNSRRGTGAPLPIALRAEFEPKFGADFSRVRIHTDAQSHQLNESIQAKAFTTGQDLFFRQGAYNPGSRGGQELLAHELTHVVQQNGGTVQRDHEQTLVQRDPIGGDPHNYSAAESDEWFNVNHLAVDVEGAKEATLKRGFRGLINTVLMETDATVKALVLAADYEAAVWLERNLYAVPVICKHRIIRAAVTGDGERIIREIGDERTGQVWVKVRFYELSREIKLTGVYPGKP